MALLDHFAYNIYGIKTLSFSFLFFQFFFLMFLIHLGFDLKEELGASLKDQVKSPNVFL